MKKEWKTEYFVASLEQVLAYYAKDFNPLDKNMEIYSFTTLVDTAKGKVLFTLVEKPKDD